MRALWQRQSTLEELEYRSEGNSGGRGRLGGRPNPVRSLLRPPSQSPRVTAQPRGFLQIPQPQPPCHFLSVHSRMNTLG